MDNNFNDSFDDFDFRPITDGLGFHHSLQEKSKIKSDLKMKSEALKSDLDTRAKKLLGESMEETKVATHSSPTHMGDLSAFYNTPEKNIEEIPKLQKVVGESTDYRFFDAPMFLRFSAWLMDTMIIATMLFSIVSLAFFAVDIDLAHFSELIFSSEIGGSFLLMFGMLYLIYFSILDMTSYSSFGKAAMKIKVVSSNKEKFGFLRSFGRSLFSLVSVASMGMITMLSFSDQMTKTRVVQK